jgi:hypothetical protein
MPLSLININSATVRIQAVIFVLNAGGRREARLPAKYLYAALENTYYFAVLFLALIDISQGVSHSPQPSVRNFIKVRHSYSL